VISAFWGPGNLQNHQESLGNINVFNHGDVKASISPKSCDFHGISWYSSKFHEIPWTSWNFMISGDFHDFCGFHDFWVPGGGRGGAKRGPPKCPPPHFWGPFPLKWPKYHWVYKQKWKGEIPAWVSWIPLFIFAYKPNGIFVILIKMPSFILLSYNNRGPPAGPGRGPAWGPSRGFRFSRFPRNFCIFRNFHDFPWFSGISWNFQFLLETGAALAADAKTLIFLREYWWFWGVLHCKVSIFCENHENHEIHGTSWNYRILWNSTFYVEMLTSAAKRTPKSSIFL
jgi:hypothetical protein